MIRTLWLALVCLYFACYGQYCVAFHGEILPMFWYVKYTGDVQVSFKTLHFDTRKLGGLLYAQLQADRTGIFTNLIYAYSHEDKNYSGYDTHLTNKFGVFTGGLFYEASRLDSNIIAPYIGVRYTIKNSYLRAANQYLMISGSHEVRWADPIVGLRDTYYFNHELYLMLSGDIGGLSTKNQYSYNLLGLVGYRLVDFADCLTLYAGYQWLYEKYRSGKNDDFFSWSMSFYGPVAGISVSF